MKGQMIFEFVIAAVLFFGIVFYSINLMNSEVNVYSGDYFMNELENKAIQVSELLVHNPGIWYGDEATADMDIVGLSNGWPIMNSTKTNLLEDYCFNNGYGAYLADNLDAELSTPYGGRKMKVYLRINEINPDKELVYSCGYEPEDVTFARVDRFGITEDGDMINISVGVWA